MNLREEMAALVKENKNLSKKYLMNLDEGLFVISGMGHSPTSPIFAEEVTPINEREAQWDRIKKTATNNRKCMIFRDKNDYIKFQKCAEKLYGK